MSSIHLDDISKMTIVNKLIKTAEDNSTALELELASLVTLNSVQRHLRYNLLEKMVEIPALVDNYIKLLTAIDQLYDRMETNNLQIDSASQIIDLLELIKTPNAELKKIKFEFDTIVLNSEFQLGEICSISK